MSFFGFDQPDDLEGDKRKFLQGALNGGRQENLAVYTWGEDSYDGLGDALQERGDELNDETFGDTGAVGKDFDFTSTGLPGDSVQHAPVNDFSKRQSQLQAQYQALEQLEHELDHRPIQPSSSSRSANVALESIWDNKSPFSVLPKGSGVTRSAGTPDRHHISSASVSHSNTGLASQTQGFGTPSREPVVLNVSGQSRQGVHTLEEIEAEMRAQALAAQQQQHRNQSPARHDLYSYNEGSIRGASPQIGGPASTGTPPPRMHHRSQSPRFHQQQQQHHLNLLIQQQQQQQQQQQELEMLQLLQQAELRQRQQYQQQILEQERRRQRQIQLMQLQDQVRLEQELERERLLQAQQIEARLLQQNRYQQHSRHESVGRLTPNSYEPHQRRMHSPASNHQNGDIRNPDAPFRDSMHFLPRDIQRQQRLLAEMAQAEFLSMQGGGLLTENGELIEDHEQQEQLRMQAMRKIMEAEQMEEKRKRKLEKIRYMSRYNDLMTQSDKDFITRIQVSQLVTQDPYTDDFYAQVYGSAMRSRVGSAAPDAVLKFGSGGGVGLGVSQVKGGHRRPSAMQRMEAQVERIVNNARLREKEKSTLNSLQGALGKTSGRSYKAAPRQLLQVDSGANGANSPTLSHTVSSSHISKADAAGHPHREGTASPADPDHHPHHHLEGATGESRDPLTARESLIILERVYDFLLDLEHPRPETLPSNDDEVAVAEWEFKRDSIVEKIHEAMHVNAGLDLSVPHPLISILAPIKGMKMLPRVTRYFNKKQNEHLLTTLVGCFQQLDVVTKSHLLDSLNDSQERRDIENQTHAFLNSVMQSILPIGTALSLKIISALLSFFLKRNNIGLVARTQPGIALLTMIVCSVAVIKDDINDVADPSSDHPTPEDHKLWQRVFNDLFNLLTPHFMLLFPSNRVSIANNIPHPDVPNQDLMDQPVWQFLASIVIHASEEQHSIMIASMREHILEAVMSAKKGWVSNEEDRALRMANVNLFLNSLGLDSSQIAL